MRPAELIPSEWQSSPRRGKRRYIKPAPITTSQPQSLSPPPTHPPEGTILRVGSQDLVRQYYKKAFENFLQINCRAIAKSYIKLLEPRKQVQYPYNGKKFIYGVLKRDPEMTKPKWWPQSVPHREPDHLLKRGKQDCPYRAGRYDIEPISDRLHLLVHILCELKDSHGVTVEKLCEASKEVRRQIAPADRVHVLDEIYYVRSIEERFLAGKTGRSPPVIQVSLEINFYITIDANTLVRVVQTYMPEVDCKDHELDTSSRPLALAPASVHTDLHDASGEGHASQIGKGVQSIHPQSLSFPLSTTTCESSGTCSSLNGEFDTCALGMSPPQNQSPYECLQQSFPSYDHNNHMSAYLVPPFVPVTAGNPQR